MIYINYIIFYMYEFFKVKYKITKNITFNSSNNCAVACGLGDHTIFSLGK